MNHHMKIPRHCHDIFHETMAYLDDFFVNKQGTGLEKYKQVTEHKFLIKLDNSLQYIELRNFKGFSEWFECKISDVPQTCCYGSMFFIHKRQGALDHIGGKLVGKFFMVGQILEELVEEEGKACTMDGRMPLKPFGPNWKSGYVMDSKHIKCAPIVEWRQSRWLWCGVQGVNQNI